MEGLGLTEDKTRMLYILRRKHTLGMYGGLSDLVDKPCQWNP